MQDQRRTSKRDASHQTIVEAGALSAKTKARRVSAGAASIAFALALTACSGHSGTETTSAPAPSLESMAASAAGSDTVPLQMSLKMNTNGLSSDATNDRFIIKYKNGTDQRGSASAVQSRLQRLAGAFPAKARHLRRMGVGADVVTTERKLDIKDAKAFMRAIASDPDVEYVEPDTEMSTTMLPNDPEYFRQWSLTSNQASNGGAPGIRAEGAWDVANGSGSVIAVIDNGVTSHNDLNANILPGYDFTAKDRGGNGVNPGITTETCAVQWHGTHVAGIAAALTNNGSGIAGVSPAAKVVPVRVLNACGKGYTSDISDGIVWAAGGNLSGVSRNAYPAKIINVSLGGGGFCETTLQDAIDYATGQGAVVVAAAGNNGYSATNFSPANCRNVINVGGSNRYGARWLSSDYGPTVDIAAPADSIWSTYNSGSAAPGNESFAFLAGTSMAAPMVSGVIALIQSVAPTPLTPDETRTLLTQNVQPFPSGQPDQPLGQGILDAKAAVIAARSGKIPVAANFKCSEAAMLMQVKCTDMSTARGASIKSWSWQFGDGRADFVSTQSVNPYVNYDYPGTYEITFTVTDSSGAVSKLTRPFQVFAPAVTNIDANAPATFSANSGDMLYFALDVPANARNLTFRLSPGANGETGTLYIRAGTPSVLHPDCGNVWTNGPAATCTIANPAPKTYYAIVNANRKLDGASILATYIQP